MGLDRGADRFSWTGGAPINPFPGPFGWEAPDQDCAHVFCLQRNLLAGSMQEFSLQGPRPAYLCVHVGLCTVACNRHGHKPIDSGVCAHIFSSMQGYSPARACFHAMDLCQDAASTQIMYWLALTWPWPLCKDHFKQLICMNWSTVSVPPPPFSTTWASPDQELPD